MPELFPHMEGLWKSQNRNLATFLSLDFSWQRSQ